MPNKPENITQALAGARVEVTTQVELASYCDNKKARGYWYCETHLAAFPNNVMKDSHIGRGKHRLAWFCMDCNRWEGPTETPAQAPIGKA